MKSSLRTRSTRVFAVGALSAALLTAGTAGAFAAEPNPNPKATRMAEPKATLKPNPQVPHRSASITTKVNRTEVRVGDRVTLTGRTDGLEIGSPVVLERYYSGKWEPMSTDIHATINKASNYTLDTRLPYKGREQLRVRVGNVVSQPVAVTVK
ncbi:hypothetical protein [Streptomyces colonosanans]|uniref:Bacterial Ig domain-containing protein n=1 Tax=Streptomyces colonosanans TaxID=1428652 RepID=A0A1S2Q1X7_9ACTN|nr:hypothetical protein [Streptomyces colonosanans]OIK00119.1 hypothetical protein BIV24_03640 [Streptomyces colonosanans]